MNWKSRIEALLAIDGITVDSIAAAMGVTGNAIREIISGRTKAPRADAALALLDLCNAHGIDGRLTRGRRPQRGFPRRPTRGAHE